MNIRKPKKIKNRDLDDDMVAKMEAVLDQLVEEGLAWKGANGRYFYTGEEMGTKQ